MARADEVLRKYLALPLLERSRATAKVLKALETGEVTNAELVAEVVPKVGPEEILRRIDKLPASVLVVARDTMTADGWSLSHDIAVDVLERYTDAAAWRDEADAVASVLLILKRGWGPPESKKHFTRLAEHASSTVAEAVARAVEVGELASVFESAAADVTWLYLLAEGDHPRAEEIWRDFSRREREDHAELVHHLYLASLHVSASSFEPMREELHGLAREANPGTSYPQPPKVKTRQANERGAKGPASQEAKHETKRPKAGRRAKQAPGEPAAARLRALTFDEGDDPAQHAKIAKDLVAVRDRLSAVERRRIIGGLARQSPTALLRAARKPLNHEVGAEVVRKLSQRKSLPAQFFVTAAEHDVAQEAAELLFRLDQAANFPELVRRLPKLEASDALLEATRAFLARPGLAGGRLGSIDGGGYVTFWGLVGLLAKQSSPASVASIDEITRALSKKRKALYAATPADRAARLPRRFGSGAEANALGERLWNTELERRRKTEAAALARRLGLSFAEAPEWTVSIWLAEGTPNEWFGALQEGPQIHLRLDVEARPDWRVELRDEDTTLDGARGGELGQDELGPLKRLGAFPEWVVDAGRKLGMRFSIDEAVINCGRHRSAASKLRAWLRAKER